MELRTDSKFYSEEDMAVTNGYMGLCRIVVDSCGVEKECYCHIYHKKNRGYGITYSYDKMCGINFIRDSKDMEYCKTISLKFVEG